nr:hypothetical protein [Lachnospiraceae bacterium]
MKSFKVTKRILAITLALVLTFTSAGVNSLTAWAAERTVDSELIVPFGIVSEFNAETGIGVVWGAAGYDLYTVTITSDNGYKKVYEDQTLGYKWYPDEYADGVYTVSIQGQSGEMISNPGIVTVTVGNPDASGTDPVTPGEDESGNQGSETPGEGETGNQGSETPAAEMPAYTVVGENLATSVEGKHEEWVEWSNADILEANGAVFITVTGYEGYECYQTRVEQAGLSLEAGSNYVISFDIVSSKDKIAMLRCDDLNNGYAMLFDDLRYTLKAGEKTTVTVFTGALGSSSENARVFAGFGMVENNDAFKVGDHTLKVENLKICKINENIPHSVYTKAAEKEIADSEAYNFKDGDTELYVGTDWAGAVASVSENGTVATVNVENFGWGGEWGMQYILKDLGLKDNTSYVVEFDITSTVNKNVFVKLNDEGDGFLHETLSLTAGETLRFSKEVDCGAFCAKPYLFFALGKMGGDGDLQGGTVTISGLKFKEVKNDAGTIEIPKGPEYDFNDNSGDFADP